MEVTKEVKVVKYSPTLPDYKDFLKAGVHFGHQTNKWNPKAKSFIFGARNGIHIIDVNKTIESLNVSLAEIAKAASFGNVLIVGTKNQAKDIVEAVAKDAGAFYVTHRWVGGLLTNFKHVKKSLDRLRKLESDFETGIEGRTKQEISWMKKEWMRLDRLYGGIKTMEYLPKLIVVVDPTFEKSVILEADELNIVTVGLIDTNTDPSVVTYPIFTNDDALSAIKMIMGLIGDAVKNGNKGNGVKHVQRDYSKVEVKKIVKKVEEVVKAKKVRVRVQKEVAKVKPVEKVVKKEEVKEEKKEKTVKKVAKKATPAKKAAPKKAVTKKVAKKATK